MSQQRKKFNAPPKRFQPRGLNVIYEDHDILVVDKASGLLTVGTDKLREQSALFLLQDYVRKGDPKSRKQAYIVHRLDRDTSGVLIFAKSEQAQRHLQDEWGSFRKLYYAVVQGLPEKEEGVLSSYLTENSVHRVYSTSDKKKGKLAQTRYRVVKKGEASALVEIELLTGRKNQIRVQFADAGHPVVGDKKYGLPPKDGSKKPAAKPTSIGSRPKASRRLALHAESFTCTHPFTKEEMTFKAPLPALFHTLLKASL